MFLLPFLTVILLFVSLIGFLPITLKKHQYFLLFFVIALCYPFSLPFGQLSTYIVLFCSISLIATFSCHKIATITAALFGYLFNVVLNQWALSILFLATGLSISTLTEYEVIIFSFTYLVLLIFTIFLLRKSLIKNIAFLLKKEYQFFWNLLFFEELLCAAIYIFLFVYGERIGYPPQIIATNGMLFTMLFITTIILLFFITHTLHKEYTSRQEITHLQELQAYVNDLENLYQIVRTMNHDYKNLFSTACTFIDSKDLDGLRSFYNKSLSMLSTEFDVSNKEIGNLSSIHIPEIKGILYSKALAAIAQNLTLKIRIDYSVEHISIDTTDMVRILGIYWDNAIEGALLTSRKEIYFHISKNDNETVWSIINTCTDLNYPISKINELGFSTKGSRRGIGLHTVSTILHSYPQVLSNTQIENNYFIQKS